MRAGMPSFFSWILSAVMLSSCAQSRYIPQSVAQGELALLVRSSGFELWAGGPVQGQRVARTATGYAGLERYVACIPDALKHARLAHAFARGGQAASAMATLFAAAGMSLFVAHVVLGYQPDGDTHGLDRGTLTLGALGIASTLTAIPLYNQANGNALDAVNFYNDQLGSAGGSCANPTLETPVVTWPSLQSPND